jgi:hypothetical protein
MFTGAYSDNVGGVERRIDEAESIGQRTRQKLQPLTRSPNGRQNEPTQELLQNIESGDAGLSARGLANHLGVAHPTIGRKKKKGADMFAAWSKELDPDGLAWEFREDKYYSLPKESESSG